MDSTAEQQPALFHGFDMSRWEPELVKRFRRYHQDNPQVYKELRSLALELVSRGRKQYGIGGLFEVLRWQSALRADGDDFKLNNNYRAFYARLLMHNEPALEGFFSTRKSQADSMPVEDDDE